MIKKITIILMALILATVSLTACSDNTTVNTDTTSSVSSQTNNDNSSTTSQSSNFSDSDYKDVTSETENAVITLLGSEGTISDTTRGSSGSEVTITSKGIYKVTGSSENVTIKINDTNQSGNIYLILDNVSMTNTSNACIYVEACDKLIIQCTGKNFLTYNNSDSNSKIDGAIYSKDDITINGSGSLDVNSSLHGIVCKEDMKITGATLNINSDNIGIQSRDSLRIDGGTTTIQSDHDGIQLENDDNTSYFCMENGSLTVNSGYDGISVKSADSSTTFKGSVKITGGTVNITAGGGSDNSKSSTSQKGIKCDGEIDIENSTVTISSADDAIHGKDNFTINSGTLNLSTSDDGITATGIVTINSGDVTVSKSYEGIEGGSVVINGGNISVTSSDDGINTSGGSDTTAKDDALWAEDSTGNINISGGNIYINASGDGLDSNGSVYVSGGTTIIEGPTTDNNGAIDKGDGDGFTASITGGTVLALGTPDMAVNFDSGSQCSALVNISGSKDTVISVDDGSEFTFTATKNFTCAVYSSPKMTQGNIYTLTAGSNTAKMDFSSDIYYTDIN